MQQAVQLASRLIDQKAGRKELAAQDLGKFVDDIHQWLQEVFMADDAAGLAENAAQLAVNAASSVEVAAKVDPAYNDLAVRL